MARRHRMPSWLERFRSWRKQRRNYYMLDSRKLQPGDIFFSTERAAESFFIRLFTLSGYSHASIYLGDSLYAEAVGLGVRVRSTTTFVKESIKVTRLKGGAPSQAVALAAANRVDHYLHVPYALPSAILSIFGRLPSKDERALFCSQLVAQAYADIGIAVVPKLDAVKVTPAL